MDVGISISELAAGRFVSILLPVMCRKLAQFALKMEAFSMYQIRQRIAEQKFGRVNNSKLDKVKGGHIVSNGKINEAVVQ